mgnify:CR=1 FL=1
MISIVVDDDNGNDDGKSRFWVKTEESMVIVVDDGDSAADDDDDLRGRCFANTESGSFKTREKNSWLALRKSKVSKNSSGFTSERVS